MPDTPMPDARLDEISALYVDLPEGEHRDKRLVQTVPELLAEVRRARAAEADARVELADWNQAQRHAAFVTCGHGLRHVTMLAFGQKISEKRDALAQRAEAVVEANRARKAEAEAHRLLAEAATEIDWAAEVLSEHHLHEDGVADIRGLADRLRALLAAKEA